MKERRDLILLLVLIAVVGGIWLLFSVHLPVELVQPQNAL